jgi:hypothetical protein
MCLTNTKNAVEMMDLKRKTAKETARTATPVLAAGLGTDS